MSNTHGSKWIRPAKRLAIYARDGFACVYCGGDGESGHGLSLDHVTPRELGGTHAATNLVTSCVSCNSSKQDSSNREFFATLRDAGVNTATLSARIKRQTRTPIDLDLGKNLLSARKA